MTVALAESPRAIETPHDFDPHLRMAASDRVRLGASTENGNPDLLSRLVEAPVVPGVRDPIEFRAQISAGDDGSRTSLNVFADLAKRGLDGQQAVVLRCRAGALTIALITLLDPARTVITPTDVEPPILFWALAPRGADATARVELLDFLRNLHREGLLRVLNTDTGKQIGALEADPAPFDPELERDWAFLRDVATLEEWSDMPLPLPVEVEADEVARIHEAAEFVRDRRVPHRLAGDIAAVVTTPVSDADELVLEQDFGVEVFGYDVPLGTGSARLAVDVVDSRLDPLDPARIHVTFRPLAPGDRVFFELAPPPERAARRWTLAPGEHPVEGDTEAWWDDGWAAGEREADDALRAANRLSFASDDAFLTWLTDLDAGATS